MPRARTTLWSETLWSLWKLGTNGWPWDRLTSEHQNEWEELGVTKALAYVRAPRRESITPYSLTSSRNSGTRGLNLGGQHRGQRRELDHSIFVHHFLAGRGLGTNLCSVASQGQRWGARHGRGHSVEHGDTFVSKVAKGRRQDPERTCESRNSVGTGRKRKPARAPCRRRRAP